MAIIKKPSDLLDQSLEIKKKIGDIAGESRCYGNLGNTYNSLGDYQKAIEYHNQSLEIAKRIGDIADESMCCLNLSIIYSYKTFKEPEKAFDYLKQSIDLTEKITSNIIEDQHKNRIYRAFGQQIFYDD